MRGIASISRFTSLRCLLFRPPPPPWKPYRSSNSRSMLPRNTPFKPPGSSQTDATPIVISEDDSFGKKQAIGHTPKLYDNFLSSVREPLIREVEATMSEREMQVIRRLREEKTTLSERQLQVIRRLREEKTTLSERQLQENPFYILLLKVEVS